MVCQSENTQSVAKFLQAVMRKLGYCPLRIMIDKSRAEMAAVMEVARDFADNDVGFILCWFHVMQALERLIISPACRSTPHWGLSYRWLKKKSNGVNAEIAEKVKSFFSLIHYEEKEATVELLMTLLMRELELRCGTSHKLIGYLRTEWWPLVKMWSKAFRPRLDEFDTDTNNCIENYHGRLKDIFLGGTHNKRVDTLVEILRGRVSRWYRARSDRHANMSMSKIRKHLGRAAIRAKQLFDQKKVDAFTCTETGDLKGRVASWKPVGVHYEVNLTELTCGCTSRSTLLCHHLLALILAQPTSCDIDFTQRRRDVKPVLPYSKDGTAQPLDAIENSEEDDEHAADASNTIVQDEFIAKFARLFQELETSKVAGQLGAEGLQAVTSYAKNMAYTTESLHRRVRVPTFSKPASKQRGATHQLSGTKRKHMMMEVGPTTEKTKSIRATTDDKPSQAQFVYQGKQQVKGKRAAKRKTSRVAILTGTVNFLMNQKIDSEITGEKYK
jgi:hypothetical protein